MADKTQAQKQKKPLPPSSGFSVVADFWLLGAILLYVPTYFAITDGWQTPFVILGFVCLAISILGASIELGKLLKSEGVSSLD